jgi:hypothetical protein
MLPATVVPFLAHVAVAQIPSLGLDDGDVAENIQKTKMYTI